MQPEFFVEIIWQKTLQQFGFTEKEILDFIPGPAYTAWWLMGTWLDQARNFGRTEYERNLAERNARMQIIIWGPDTNPDFSSLRLSIALLLLDFVDIFPLSALHIQPPWDFAYAQGKRYRWHINSRNCPVHSSML